MLVFLSEQCIPHSTFSNLKSDNLQHHAKQVSVCVLFSMGAFNSISY